MFFFIIIHLYKRSLFRYAESHKHLLDFTLEHFDVLIKSLSTQLNIVKLPQIMKNVPAIGFLITACAQPPRGCQWCSTRNVFCITSILPWLLTFLNGTRNGTKNMLGLNYRDCLSALNYFTQRIWIF